MRVPGRGSPRRARARSIAAAADGRADAGTARRAARRRRRRAGRSSAILEVERRHPPVPFWTAALDTEQQVEQAATLKRSEEHTSELQSLAYLVCRLLLEKKKK